MTAYYPAYVLVNETVADRTYCNAILSRLKPSTRVKTMQEPELEQLLRSGRIGTQNPRKTLVLTRNKGAWLKPCPGTTANYLCCNYQILHIGTNCNMSCTYCILQYYFQYREMTLFCNTNDLFAELNQYLRKKNRPYLRLGTGEFTDSLCLDHITEFSKQVIPLFAKSDRAVLELKTKSSQIQNLLHLNPQGRVVASWSLNSERIAKQEEHGAVSLLARLRAARQCEEVGYWIGFHFDPIVPYPGWEGDYQAVVNRIFDTVKDPAHIAWISLGILRYPPFLSDFIKQRHPQSQLPYGEFILGNDRKLRYFKPIRINVYRKMNVWIKARHPKAVVYLCMESPSVWEASLGKRYNSNKPIAEMLTRSVSW